MKFNSFISASLDHWNSYFRVMSLLFKSGRLRLEQGKVFYPNVALFTETDDHFIIELFGADEEFKGLTRKQHKERSTLKYLYQFSFDHHKVFL